jgi:hypothetical protein
MTAYVLLMAGFLPRCHWTLHYMSGAVVHGMLWSSTFKLVEYSGDAKYEVYDEGILFKNADEALSQRNNHTQLNYRS